MINNIAMIQIPTVPNWMTNNRPKAKNARAMAMLLMNGRILILGMVSPDDYSNMSGIRYWAIFSLPTEFVKEPF
jgi:hypothetical protein